MISIEAWRRAIGGFSHPRAARVSVQKQSFSSHEDYSMSARLVCTAMMMWVVVFTHFSINMFMQKYTSTNTNDVVTDCRLTCMSTNSSINSQVITDITDICTNGLQSTYLFQTISKDAQKLFPFSTLLRSGIEPNPGPCTLEDLSKVIKKSKKNMQPTKPR